MAETRHRQQSSSTLGWNIIPNMSGLTSPNHSIGLPSFGNLKSSEMSNAVMQSIADDLIDDAILNVVFEVHKSAKTGLLFLETGSIEDEPTYRQITSEGLDVFGQAPVKKQHECVCPNCSRNMAASRFAPHLEKCMGMGRNSSRIASRRIQNSCKENAGGGGSHLASDEDEDDDWVLDRKRKKRDKNSPRRSKIKGKGESVSSSSSVESAIFANGTLDDKRELLRHICGVVSGHTKKMCTRSLKCPQHTRDQRRALRDQLLLMPLPGELSARIGIDSSAVTPCSSLRGSIADSDDVPIDIDGLDGWEEHDRSGTTSPADSTSTNNSSTTSSFLPVITTSGSNGRRKGEKKSSSKSSKSSSSSHGSLLD